MTGPKQWKENKVKENGREGKEIRIEWKHERFGRNDVNLIG